MIARKLPLENGRMFAEPTGNLIRVEVRQTWLSQVITAELTRIRRRQLRTQRDPVGPFEGDKCAD